MFRIPAFFKFDMNFNEAQSIMTRHGRGDILEGMQAMNNMWEEHCAGSTRFDSDSDLYEWYEAEVNAYNVVFETMRPMFH
tara:strand:- start:1238 stop:1477 length:240 start_codon:yes stop_codon:yes gene_type:complete